VLEALSSLALEIQAATVVHPRAAIWTGLVGDLIGVATKRSGAQPPTSRD
jgi:hypothetical protein